MAVTSANYVVGAVGHIYLAPADTAAPEATNAALSAPVTPWTELGFVGSGENGGDNLPSWSSDGGDKTVLGAWNNSAVRTITDALTETLNFTVSSFERTALQLYTSADGGDTTGRFDVLGTEVGKGVERALLVVIHDGPIRVGFYSPRANISRGDDITISQDDAVVFPLAATLLDPTGGGPRYSWIAPDLLEIEETD